MRPSRLLIVAFATRLALSAAATHLASGGSRWMRACFGAGRSRDRPRNNGPQVSRQGPATFVLAKVGRGFESRRPLQRIHRVGAGMSRPLPCPGSSAAQGPSVPSRAWLRHRGGENEGRGPVPSIEVPFNHRSEHRGSRVPSTMKSPCARRWGRAHVMAISEMASSALLACTHKEPYSRTTTVWPASARI